MRILICTTTYSPDLNGQSVFCKNLAEGMASRGHKVLVLQAARQDGPRVSNGVEMVSLPVIQLGFIHADLRISVGHASAVRRVFDTFQPDLVHVQDSAPFCQEALKIAQRRGIPGLATHHPGPEISAPYFVRWSRPYKSIAERFAWRYVMAHLNQADLVITPSQSSVRMLAGQGLRRPARALSCGVRLDNFFPNPGLDRAALLAHYGIPTNRPILLYVGRVDGEKRVEVLVRALAHLKREDLHLVIAGTGAVEGSLRRLSNRLGLDRRVHFLGKVAHEDLPELINCADIFSMPGDCESFSIATLEAMACGKPILAANSAALPELVTHGENGYLFHRGDPQDAARMLQAMLENRPAWVSMGQASALRAQRHRLERVLGQFESLYLKCLSEPFTRPAPAVEKSRRWVLKPLFALVFLMLVLFSSVYNPPATQAAPLLRFETLAPINLEEIFERFLQEAQTSPDFPEEGQGFKIELEQGKPPRIVIRYYQQEPANPDAVDGEEPSLTVREQMQAIYTALVELGVPAEMIDFLELPGSSDGGPSLHPWPRWDTLPQ